MPRPPFTRFPKDPPLPPSQRGELTKAFKTQGGGSGGTSVTNIVEQATGGSSGGTGAITNLVGDVTGSPSANTLTKIQGTPLAIQTIVNGQAYVLIAGKLTPSFLAGDVTGSLVLNVVQGIQGVTVASGLPADRQELVYDASAGMYTPGANPGALLWLWTYCS